MKKGNIDDFSFTRSFVFLKPQRRVKKSDLRDIFASIQKKTEIALCFRSIVRHRLSLGTAPLTYGSVSLLLGRSVQTPPFANGSLHEQLISYVLVIETKGFAAVQFRHISINDVGDLFDFYKKVSHTQITSIISNSAKILKLSAKIINPAQNGLTGRAYEGNSLENEMPSYGSGKTIPRNVKANDGGQTISITAGASRLTAYGQAVSIDAVGSWFHTAVKLLEANVRSKFIGRFAEPVDFYSAIGTLIPKLVVFETLAMRALIRNDGLILRRKYKKFSANASDAMFDNVIGELEKLQPIQHGKFALGEVEVVKSKLKIRLSAFRNFVLFNGTNEVQISTYLNNKDLFSIYFDSIEHVYMSGAIFKDVAATNEIGTIIAAMELVPALAGADREKILRNKKDLTSSAAFTSFPSTSVFDISEKFFIAHQYMFCDDLGDEWADHIAIDSTTKTMVFVHSKYGTSSTGASKLHDVVGQALKNMGNLICAPSIMVAKIDGFNQVYTGTLIPRIRRVPVGQSVNTTKIEVQRILNDNNFSREVALCCSFLSHKAVKDELQALQKGLPVRPHIKQLVWLLSYFISASKEMSIKPRILCAP